MSNDNDNDANDAQPNEQSSDHAEANANSPFPGWRQTSPEVLAAGLAQGAQAFYSVLERGASLASANAPATNAQSSNEAASGTKPSSDDTPDDTQRVIEFLARAYMTWTADSLQHWSTLTAMHGSYLNAMNVRIEAIRANPDDCESEQRALSDEAARFLRQTTDVNMQHTQALKTQMDTLCAQMHESLAQPNPDGRYRRYGKVKA